MTGLLKDSEAPLSVRFRRKILGKATKDRSNDGQQEGAPGFTKFKRPAAESARPRIKTPLGG